MTEAKRAHSPNYLAIFAWLIVLTVLEVGVTYLGLSRGATAALLIGSSIAKAALVLLYFMHLRHEARLILTLVIVTALLGAVFILGLFPDIVVGYWK